MEQIADGVWLVRGGVPRVMNVYLIEDEGGMTMFDAGIKGMEKHLAQAAAPYGGIKRIVLGHGHADHRGSAALLASAEGIEVFCHESEVADAEGDGGLHYFHIETLSFPPARFLMPKMLKSWDGGPVKISGSLNEGDSIAGFDVVHLPGHAPGLIGLWRESDGVALVSDTFYTLDPQTGRKGAPRVPLGAFNLDTEMAKASIRKLSALDPKIAWPGHAGPMVKDVGDQLVWLADHGGTLKR
jgi:hydroxyacylglutathione hydrolase